MGMDVFQFSQNSMVGFEPSAKHRLSPSEHAVAGAISGFCTRALLQPLDVLKIRFQLQIEPIKHQELNAKYRGVVQAFGRIYKEEGVKALWKGHVPAQGLSILYGLVQFSTFETLTEWFWQVSPPSWTEEKRPLVHFTCGSVAGCVATVAVHPFDVLRTRFVAQGEPKIYQGFADAIRQMLVKEGPLAFYRGLVPTVVQIGPYVGAQFGFYRLFQELFGQLIKPEEYGLSVSAVSGALAGVSAKLLTYPLDLVKKRLQIQGFEAARKPFGQVRSYSNMRHCFFCVISEEGFKGLFKGLSPSLFKAALATSCHMTIFEATCQLLLTTKLF